MEEVRGDGSFLGSPVSLNMVVPKALDKAEGSQPQQLAAVSNMSETPNLGARLRGRATGHATLRRVLGRFWEGSQKGSQKGSCYGFTCKKKAIDYSDNIVSLENSHGRATRVSIIVNPR